MRVRVSVSVVVAALTVASLAACGATDGTGTASSTPSATGATGSVAAGDSGLGAAEGADPSGGGTPQPTPAQSTATHPAGVPLTCRSIETAEVGNAAVPLEDIPDKVIKLADGRWSNVDVYLELAGTCGVGDLNGDGSADAVSGIVIDTGGTGKFYSLVAWTSEDGRPALVASKSLGDRTPIEAITIDNTSHRITVVYLTRTPDAPSAAINLRRTAVYRIEGNRLVEVSHTDEPYQP